GRSFSRWTMRTQLLCALALLGGAAIAHAQGVANVPGGYFPGTHGAPGWGGQPGADPSGHPGGAGVPMGSGGSPDGAPPAGDQLPPHPVQAPPFPLDLEDAGWGVPDCCKCKFWVSAGYTLSWIRSGRLHFPLVTTGPARRPPAPGRSASRAPSSCSATGSTTPRCPACGGRPASSWTTAAWCR